MKIHDLTTFNFSSRIVISKTGCWNWTKSLTPNGYGKLKFAGKDTTAHRISWLKYRGDIPDGMLVCHKCDNKKCANPEHLFVGTSADNNHDMIHKGRHYHGDRHWSRTNPERLKRGDSHPMHINPSLACRGEHHGRFGNPRGTGIGECNGFSKLTGTEVTDIRSKFKAGTLQYKLAEEYNVSNATIQRIVRGTSWTHISMPKLDAA